MWQAALVPTDRLNMDPFALPVKITFDNIIKAWTVGKMSTYMINSVLVAVPRVAGVLILSSLAGYAFGKLKFWGRDKNIFLYAFWNDDTCSGNGNTIIL